MNLPLIYQSEIYDQADDGRIEVETVLVFSHHFVP